MTVLYLNQYYNKVCYKGQHCTKLDRILVEYYQHVKNEQTFSPCLKWILYIFDCFLIGESCRIIPEFRIPYKVSLKMLN